MINPKIILILNHSFDFARLAKILGVMRASAALPANVARLKNKIIIDFGLAPVKTHINKIAQMTVMPRMRHLI